MECKAVELAVSLFLTMQHTADNGTDGDRRRPSGTNGRIPAVASPDAALCRSRRRSGHRDTCCKASENASLSLSRNATACLSQIGQARTSAPSGTLVPRGADWGATGRTVLPLVHRKAPHPCDGPTSARFLPLVHQLRPLRGNDGLGEVYVARAAHLRPKVLRPSGELLLRQWRLDIVGR